MTSENELDKRVSSLLLYLGLLPVLFLILIIGALELVYNEHPVARLVFEPPLLLPILHTSILFPASCIVAFVAMRSYIRSGSPCVLLLGCGVLTLGLGVLPAGWLLGPEGTNVNVIIFNLTVFFSSIFHAAGIVYDLMGKPLETDERRRRRNLTIAYSGVVILVSLYSLAAGTGILPKFFIQGEGPTPLRQAVLAITFFLYMSSSTSLMIRFVQERVHFLYWYSLALAMLALSIVAAALQPAVGSPMGWVGRIGQYMGGIYFIFAVVSAMSGVRSKGLSINEAISEIFRQSEKISAIYAHITECCYELDRDWHFTGINDRALSYFGKSRTDFVGRTYWEVLPEGKGSIFEEQYRKVLMEDAPAHFEVPSITVPGKWLEFNVYPVEEGISVYFRDVTERKRMEEELRTSESRFRLLSGTAGRLLASQNPQKIVKELCLQVMEHLGCHAFFNFLVDELVGKLHLNACAGIPDEEARNIEWLDYGVAVCGCVAREGKRIVAEDIFNTPDIRTELVKSYGIQAYACHPLEAQGKLIGTLSFGTKTRTSFSDEDLALMKTVADQVATAMEKLSLTDELRKSRDELELRVQERTAELNSYMAKLEQSNQALQDFASIALHDLQEPLRKVAAFGNMLKQKCGGLLEDHGKDYLERILNANQRMQSLLTGLLNYSRVTTKAEPFKKVDLSDLVGEVISDLEVRIVKTRGEVNIGDLPVISADPTQMRQLFQNLIGNALKFHKPGEKPMVQVRSISNTGSGCQIVVEDNGIGFEEQYLERIFAPFHRLHGKSSQYEGTGMGLAICKKIVERHGGSITARSTPGEGATFVIELPVKHTNRTES